MNSPSMVYIALGSNLGDSPRILLQALRRLETLSDHPLRRSSFWRTSPVDCPPGSPPFLNAVVELVPRPGETPESLLAKLQALERKCGRRIAAVRNAPRILDLDLIAFGAERRTMPELVLPHPRAHQRRFVLEPLAEIAPDLVLPGQSRTVALCLGVLDSSEKVQRLE